MYHVITLFSSVCQIIIFGNIFYAVQCVFIEHGMFFAFQEIMRKEISFIAFREGFWNTQLPLRGMTGDRIWVLQYDLKTKHHSLKRQIPKHREPKEMKI
jgi:hypothetical protein